MLPEAVDEACQVPYFHTVRVVVTAIANEDRNQNVAALDQRAKACVRPAIQWFYESSMLIFSTQLRLSKQ